MSAYKDVMDKLAKSSDLANDTFYRVKGRITVLSALDPQKLQNLKQDKSYNPVTFDSTSKKGKCKPNPTETASTISDYFESGVSQISPRRLEMHELNKASDSNTTCPTTNAISCGSLHKKDDPFNNQKQNGKTLNSINHAMKMMTYHMGRISFECESCFQDIPLSEMSKADRRHCRRFHKGLLGRKKAGEKRNSRH